MPKNRLPILLFLAGQDRIIDNAGVLRVLERGGQDVLDVVEYEDQTHSIQFDAPQRLVDDMSRWIEQQCASGRAKRE
jgi:alpha-beta hydrolase superfamily lysophospholipase